MWILLLYTMAGQPVNHAPFVEYPTKEACEIDRAALTDPNALPLWKGTCKQAKPTTPAIGPQ